MDRKVLICLISLQIYDVIGDGLLGVDEVVRLANDLGFGSISGEQATSLISLVDDDGDGKINFEGNKIELITCTYNQPDKD